MRILFIPHTESVRTSERTPMMLRTLKQRHDVVAVPAPWDHIVYEPSRALWPRMILYGVDKILMVLRGLALGRRARPQVVFCETAHHALAGIVIARILGIRCVWDSHGNGKLLFESLGKGRWSVRLIEALERFLGRRVDSLITVSEVDAAAYAEMGLPPTKIHIIPLCVNLTEIDSATAGRSDPAPARVDRVPVLLFFGSFRYEPNREALQFVNAYLAPHLEMRGIRCEIRIAGRDIPEIDFHPFVHPIGFVPDIYSCIRAATLCIVPVRRGVGVLTKTIDAMAVGTPLVLFDFATRGIPDLRHGVHAYVAASEGEFLRYVIEALSSPEATREMSRRARQLVERKHDRNAYVSQIRAIL